MATNGIKISALPAASAANATDQLEVNQAGTSRRITVDQLLDVTGGAYLPLDGGTLTGTLTVDIASSDDMAWNSTQDITGSSSPFTIPLNQIEIASDVYNATGGSSDGFTQGLHILHNKGGGASRGGSTALWADFKLVAPTHASSTNRNYVAVAGISTAVSGDGGANPATVFANTKGQFFGGSFQGIVDPGVVGVTNVTAAELNTTVGTGASVWAKTILQMSGAFNDAVKGSVTNAMVWAYNQDATSAKWTDGILFDDNGGTAGRFPFDATSTVMRTSGTGSTAKRGIDFSASIITEYAFISNGAYITGLGVVHGDSVDAHAGYKIDAANALVPSNPFNVLCGFDGTARVFAGSTGNGVLIRSTPGTAIQNDAGTDIMVITPASITATNVITTLSGTAIGAGANTQAFIKASSTANLGIYYGTGDPSFSAAKGSLYSKTDATTTTTRLWVNTTGSTTWATVTTSA